jgi:predicted acylesterase/phospholipase RssA
LAGRVLAGLVALSLLVSTLPGCTQRNVALNTGDVALAHRARNSTLASVGANLPPLRAGLSRLEVHRFVYDPTEVAFKPRTEGYFVGIAISGGGSRSSNFAAACLLELERLGMLRKVDYISTVSGGSLAGAYYCVAPDEYWNPQTVQEKLTQPFASDVIRKILLPWNWFALALTHYDRSDLLTESLEARLFTFNRKPATFADLRKDRPRLLINATELQSGEGFIFANQFFDRINSDLSKYPVAAAVAASSAVPLVLHPVTLRDYSTSFKRYVHLIDGGVNDNLGVLALLETYNALVEQSQEAGRGNPFPRGAMIIVIDARTEFDAKLADQGDFSVLDTLRVGAGMTSAQLINRASSATLADIVVRHAADDATAKELRDRMTALQNTGLLSATDRNGNRIQVVHLALLRVNQVQGRTFRTFTERVNRIDTFFNLTPGEAADLYLAAELLVRDIFDKPLREMVKELHDAARLELDLKYRGWP